MPDTCAAGGTPPSWDAGAVTSIPPPPLPPSPAVSYPSIGRFLLRSAFLPQLFQRENMAGMLAVVAGAGVVVLVVVVVVVVLLLLVSG